MRQLRLTGLLASLLTIALDQASKLWILDLFADPASRTRHVEVIPGFFDLVLWWNRGVSFGMLNSLHDAAPYILAGLALAVCAALAVMLWRSDHLLKTLALGVVIGGAIGNVIDRLAYGAVVDFALFQVHFG